MASFVSTRGSDGKLYTFEDAVLSGWASDGGMLVPRDLPDLSSELEGWVESDCTYKELCFQILSRFTDKKIITNDELREICDVAFQKFDIDEVIRLEELKGLNESTGTTTYVAELWHGPTLAFKDLSMQVLMGFLDKLLMKRNQKLQLLVATSGDTGASSIEGVLGKKCLSVCVLYPSKRFSSITQEQEYQTICRAGERNVTVVEVEGSSDDIDVPVEACFRDLKFKKQASLGSSNSVNIFRVMMQCVHYFYCYVKLKQRHRDDLRDNEKGIAFYVPTGGGGHVSAGVLAAEMGLPVQSIFACVNQNDVMHQLLSTGELDSNSPVEKTLAPSMDISVPYNCERIFFLIAHDQKKVSEYMQRWKSRGKVELSDEEQKVLMDVMKLKSQTVSDKEISETIRKIFEQSSYILCPHTAVAVRASLSDLTPGNVVRVCMGCAHPSKFSKTVSESLSLEPAEWMPNRGHPSVALLLRLLTTAPDTTISASTTTTQVHHLRREEKKNWEEQLRSILARAC